jgi:hypothetical protein
MIIPIANNADAIIPRIRRGIGIENTLGRKKSIIPIIINVIPDSKEAISYSRVV